MYSPSMYYRVCSCVILCIIYSGFLFILFLFKDAVLTKKIKELLKTADLEKVTMKIVRQQLIDMYPEYDLSDKRDFIKTTVKEVLVNF